MKLEEFDSNYANLEEKIIDFESVGWGTKNFKNEKDHYDEILMNFEAERTEIIE